MPRLAGLTAITVDILENIMEGFVQDNFKASRRLTLNLGVRYGYYGQPVDGSNRLSNFNRPPTLPAALPPSAARD